MFSSCYNFLLTFFLLQAATALQKVRQHKELLHRLDDAEKLQLYAKEAVSKHRALEESLDKAKSRSRYWKHKAKEGTNRTAGVENKGNEAMEEAQIARMDIVATGEAKAWVKEDLARVQGALAVAEGAKAATNEARRKAEAKAARLEVEWTSLLLELGTTKDEVSSFQSQAGKDKEPIEDELGGHLCLWLRVLCVQTRHLWRPTGGFRRHA